MNSFTLQRLLDLWQEAFLRGRDLSAQELCPDRPDLVAELQAAIDSLRRQFSLRPETQEKTWREALLPALATPPPPEEPDIQVTLPQSEADLLPRQESAPEGYRILGELGRGGMGVVFKAVQLGFDRLCALKMILVGSQAGSQDLARFRIEAQAIAQLRHPHIVTVYEIGEHRGRPFYSLEYCSGGSLDAHLDGKPLEPKEAARIVRALAGAVHFAHEANVIHRDLKPANVLLLASESSEEQRNRSRPLLIPKITDFGIAKRLDEKGNTRPGALIGTPSYMPPEQAEGKNDLGPAVDIYALGAILYECLTGRPPFNAATSIDTVRQVISEDPVPPRQLNPRVPADLEAVCLHCLEKEPERRYSTAQALAEDLDRFLHDVPTLARPVTQVERLWRWCRRNPAVAGLLAAVLLTLLGGATLSTLLAAWALRNAAASAENERRAEQARQMADEQRDRAELLVYAGKLALAQREWQDGKTERALDLLDECRWDLRGWEHRMLWSHIKNKQRTITSPAGWINGIAFLVDGKRIVTGGGEFGKPGQLQVWDFTSGRILHTLHGHSDAVLCVAVDPQGKRILSGGGDQQVILWHSEKGTPLRILRGHTDIINCLAVSSDGKRAVSGSVDTTLKVWDLANGKEQRTFSGHTDTVWCVVLNPEGTRAYSGSKDRTIRVWDTLTGKEIHTFRGHTTGVRCLAISPNGDQLVSGSEDGTLKIWDTKESKELFTLKAHTDEVTCVAFSTDGQRLFSGGADQVVKVWCPRRGSELLALKGHAASVTSLATRGSWLVTGSVEPVLRIWDGRQGPRSYPLKGHTDSVNSVAYSPNGRFLVSVSDDWTLKIWDAVKGQEMLSLLNATGRVTAVAITADSQRILSGSQDGSIQMWSVQTGQRLRTWRGHYDAVTCLAVSPDGNRLGSGSEDRTLKIWNLATGQELRLLKGHQGVVTCMAFHPDGRQLVSGSRHPILQLQAGELILWDTTTGQQERALPGHADGIWGVAYHPEGRELVSASQDGTLKVWDLIGEKERLTLRGHADGVRSVAYRPDGKWIVSGSWDGTLRCWDASTGKELLTLAGHAEPVRGVTFSPDGTRLVSGSEDRLVKVWEVGPPPSPD